MSQQDRSTTSSISSYYLRNEQFSEEEMHRDWSLSQFEKSEILSCQRRYQLFVAVQLVAVKLYGRFLRNADHLSPRIISYLSTQLGLTPVLHIESPDRKATISKYRKQILTFLEFRKFNKQIELQLNCCMNIQNYMTIR